MKDSSYSKFAGGFSGLSYEEALEAGTRAKHYGNVLGEQRWTAVYDDTYGPGNVESNNDAWNDGDHVLTQSISSLMLEYTQVLTLLLTSKQRRSVTSRWLTSGSVSVMNIYTRKLSRV